MLTVGQRARTDSIGSTDRPAQLPSDMSTWLKSPGPAGAHPGAHPTTPTCKSATKERRTRALLGSAPQRISTPSSALQGKQQRAMRIPVAQTPNELRQVLATPAKGCGVSMDMELERVMQAARAVLLQVRAQRRWCRAGGYNRYSGCHRRAAASPVRRRCGCYVQENITPGERKAGVAACQGAFDSILRRHPRAVHASDYYVTRARFEEFCGNHEAVSELFAEVTPSCCWASQLLCVACTLVERVQRGWAA